MLNFMGEHPILTVILTMIIAPLIFHTIRLIIFILPNWIIRHMNIRKHGWPPEHCDADGDFEDG